MQTSSNYNLKLPEGTDNVKRQDFVDNFTTIDSNMKAIDNKHGAYGTTSGTNTYTVSITGITSLYDGLKVTVKIGTTSTGASTLNINGLGAKTILDSLGNAITSGGLKAGIPYTLCYNGTNFILQGKGGGGNTVPGHLLENDTATTDSGLIKGSMKNNPAQTNAVSVGIAGTNTYVRIPKGAYINDVGNGYSEIVTPYSMIAAAVGVNGDAILSGNNILGVNGNIPNRGESQYAGGFGEGGDYYAMNNIPYGYYPSSGNGWAPEIRINKDTIRNALGITSNKIVSGQEIAGIWGSANAGDLLVTGTLPNIGIGSSASVNLPFTPRVVFATFYNGQSGTIGGYSSIVYSNNFPYLDNNNTGSWGQPGHINITFSGTTMIVNNTSTKNFVCAGFRWCAIQ